VRLTRVYVAGPLQSGRPHGIAGSAANHILRVLRLGAGAAVTLFDGTGGEFAARIASVRRDSLLVDVGAHEGLERESPLDVTLAQGVSRGERMDWVIQKATELGVRRIVPLISARSVVRLDPRQAERKLQHWRGISIAACEQCGRNRLPELLPPVDLPEFLGATAKEALCLVLSADGREHIRFLAPAAAVILLVGPEGGLAPQEQAAARDQGFKPVCLGPRILRTETAAIAALAALQSSCGDL
jgi:16S rRNA (uracil1498-N3)-methyltransferase